MILPWPAPAGVIPGSGWFAEAPGGHPSEVPWRRRPPRDDRYDPYDPYQRYGPPDPRWGPPRRYYYRPAPGGSCLRDACLLETGCCVAESLDGSCLVLALLAAPRLMTTLVAHGRSGITASRASIADRLVAAIGVYQREISAHRPPSCRFSPSCSEYAAQAIRSHGAARGSVLAARRLLRCRPGGRRGPDPVP